MGTVLLYELLNGETQTGQAPYASLGFRRPATPRGISIVNQFDLQLCPRHSQLEAGGKPSTWFPPGGLVEPPGSQELADFF